MFAQTIELSAPSVWLQHGCHKLVLFCRFEISPFWTVIRIVTIVYFDYVQRSCSSLYRLPRFINCPTYITLHYITLHYIDNCHIGASRCQKDDTIGLYLRTCLGMLQFSDDDDQTKQTNKIVSCCTKQAAGENHAQLVVVSH